MNNKKIGLELSGIIMTYVLNPFIAFVFFNLFLYEGSIIFVILSIFWILCLIPIILYHIGFIKNHFVPGFIAFFTNFLGGLFILTYEDNLVKKNKLEINLKQLKRLLDENIITQNEYELRREIILTKFL
jgi:hypothetical protein